MQARTAFASTIAAGLVAGIQVACSAAPAASVTEPHDVALQQLAVLTASSLPSCTNKNEGQVASISSTKTLVACVNGTWISVELPRGPMGPAGPTGAAGVASRLRITPVPSGSICAAGGQQVEVGPDSNGNGALDANEVEETAYVCNGTSTTDAGATTTDAGTTSSGTCSPTQFGPTTCDRCLAQSCCDVTLRCDGDPICKNVMISIQACELQGRTMADCTMAAGLTSEQLTNPAVVDVARCAFDEASACVGACSRTTSCLDGVKDGSESDVDCGGSCSRCGAGRICATGFDCQSLSCVSGVCAAEVASCTDGLKNGDESDADCGGKSCPSCAAGRTCGDPAECASGACEAGVCQHGVHPG